MIGGYNSIVISILFKHFLLQLAIEDVLCIQLLVICVILPSIYRYFIHFRRLLNSRSGLKSSISPLLNMLLKKSILSLYNFSQLVYHSKKYLSSSEVLKKALIAFRSWHYHDQILFGPSRLVHAAFLVFLTRTTWTRIISTYRITDRLMGCLSDRFSMRQPELINANGRQSY